MFGDDEAVRAAFIFARGPYLARASAAI